MDTRKLCPVAFAVVTLALSAPCCVTAWNADDEPKPSDPGKARVEAARKAYDRWVGEYVAGRASIRGVHIWSRRWMEGELALNRQDPERLVAIEAHVRRIRSAYKQQNQAAAKGRIGVINYLASQHYRAEAEAQMLDALLGAGDLESSEAAATRLATANLVYDDCWERHDLGRELRNPLTALEWSRRWLEAEMAVATRKDDREAAAKDYLERAKELETAFEKLAKADKLLVADLARAAFYRADAELLVATAGTTDQASTQTAAARLVTAKAAYELEKKHFDGNQGSLERLYEWSQNWRRAATAVASTQVERVVAANAHRDRMRNIHKSIAESAERGRTNLWEVWAMDYFVAEADIILAEARAAKD